MSKWQLPSELLIGHRDAKIPSSGHGASVSHDVFISYAHKDKHAADAACAVLEGRGIRCWIAPRDVKHGLPWAESILDALRGARAMVLVFSAHANQSEQIKREVERAVSMAVPIIPLRIEDVVPEKSLEYFISATHWMDAFPPPLENHLNQLADSILGLTGARDRQNARSQYTVGRAARWRPGWISIALAGATALLLAFAVVFVARLSPIEGLLVEPFRVPAKLQARGLDGNALAARLLDRLHELEKSTSTYSFRAPDHIEGDWSGATLESPMDVRKWFLDRRTRIDAEIAYTGENERMIELSVRAGGTGGTSFRGTDDQIDVLIGEAAEWSFRALLPYRYAIMLGNTGHMSEEESFLKQAQSFSKKERLWSDSKLSEHYSAIGDYEKACDVASDALSVDSDFLPASLDFANCRFELGDIETARARVSEAIEALSHNVPSDVSQAAVDEIIPQLKSRLMEFGGEYLPAIGARTPVRQSNGNFLRYKMPAWDASNYAQAHEPSLAEKVIRNARGVPVADSLAQNAMDDAAALQQFQTIGFAPSHFFVAMEREEWRAATQELKHADALALKIGNVNEARRRFVWPWLAYAYAKSGNTKTADALIAMSPQDCYDCLEMRGRIATAEGNRPGAEYWFSRAVAFAPSLAFAEVDWAKMLLQKGDAEGAVAKLSGAVRKAPHFADAYELWGEALMAQNRSDRALSKFEAANKYAPRWAHLHLKWAESLFYAGRRRDAAAQFDAISTTDLAQHDRIELSHWRQVKSFPAGGN